MFEGSGLDLLLVLRNPIHHSILCFVVIVFHTRGIHDAYWSRFIVDKHVNNILLLLLLWFLLHILFSVVHITCVYFWDRLFEINHHFNGIPVQSRGLFHPTTVLPDYLLPGVHTTTVLPCDLIPCNNQFLAYLCKTKDAGCNDFWKWTGSTCSTVNWRFELMTDNRHQHRWSFHRWLSFHVKL